MTFPERVAVWRTVMRTANLPQGMAKPPDSISKWLVITRAGVFTMTATSGLIGGLLAVGAARDRRGERRLGALRAGRASASWSPTPPTT